MITLNQINKIISVMIPQTELQALQNAADSLKMGDLKVHERFSEDKRKTLKMYFLQWNISTISPTLDYDQMNHFILGMKEISRRVGGGYKIKC